MSDNLPATRQPAAHPWGGGSVSANTSQATAVEQARAVAEVQAAVTVAQNIPRDLERAKAEMLFTCSQQAVAERAFYSVPRKGSKPVTGPSIHLAKELARIFGNITYGVREMRRDDDEGLSEIEVFAWDQQANVRNSRTLQVPHARSSGGSRAKITDLGEIVQNNNNHGARQLRECIFNLLPPWFVQAAEQQCRDTNERGDGTPLAQRIDKMLALFAKLGVTQAQIEGRVGSKRGQWTAGDVARLGTDYNTIINDGVDAESIFGADTTTLDALVAQATPELPDGQMVPRGKATQP